MMLRRRRSVFHVHWTRARTRWSSFLPFPFGSLLSHLTPSTNWNEPRTWPEANWMPFLSFDIVLTSQTACLLGVPESPRHHAMPVDFLIYITRDPVVKRCCHCCRCCWTSLLTLNLFTREEGEELTRWAYAILLALTFTPVQFRRLHFSRQAGCILSPDPRGIKSGEWILVE